MSKRLLILVCAVALTAAACGSIPEGEVVAGEGARFVPFVTEFLDDAGLGNAIAVDAEGVPYASYLIFPAVLEEGEIPVGRPLGAPYITTDDPEPKDGAAVGVASVSADGVWTRGAVAQVRETPTGVFIPFGPAFEQSLVGATAENTNGTDIAVDDAGTTHVVWTGRDGVYYASGTDASSVERVFDYGFTLRRAGPIGRPSVAVDADGVPWVAYTVNVGGEQEIRVAAGTDEGWDTQTVASIPTCESCPPPLPTQVDVTDAGPMVAWVDTDAGSVMVSTSEGRSWAPTEVLGGVSGEGLDMAVDAEGKALLTFYDGEGGVHLARQDGDSWSDATIAEATPPDEAGTGNLAPMTGIAIDDQGALAAAWESAEGVVLATSEDGDTFTPLETLDTAGGRSPSVGVSPDGANVFLTWYDVEGENLRFGVQGEISELAVAAPSPTIDPGEVPAPAPDGGGECGVDGEILLDIVASGVAWDTSCLVAPAGEAFTVNIDNQDAGIPHNFDLMTEEGGDQIGEPTAIEPGPVQQAFDSPALDPGEYFFLCDVHPTMTGTLVAIEVK